VTSAPAFDRARLLSALASLDEALQAQDLPRQDLIVVGGSYLALAHLRDSTMDVDVVTRLTEVTRRAVAEVADRHGVSAQWLNDHAATFRPHGLTAEHCTTVVDGVALRVLAPSADWIFLMKMYAGRLVDRPDLVRLWPHTGFTTPADAVARYWQAYPHAPEDPYLAGFVTEILRQVRWAKGRVVGWWSMRRPT